MKTNKFENTIRRKLESIEPDFHEQDWARMQNYMQAHTPPTFLQQYGSWIGYAAAASVTSVMAYMYVSQLSQNNRLVTDVKKLQSQIEVIKNQTPQVAKTDTVFVLQTTPDGQSLRATELARSHYRAAADSYHEHREELALAKPARTSKLLASTHANAHSYGAAPASAASNEERGNALFEDSAGLEPVLAQQSANDAAGFPFAAGRPGNSNTVQPSNAVALPIMSRTFASDFEIAAIDSPAEMNTVTSLKRKMQYDLVGKLSARQVQKALLASNIQAAKAIVSGRKAEQITQTETVIPKLPIKTPYRFGAGYQIEGNGQGKTVLGEVIVKKKFSISAGITWLKVKPAEFFTETIFREKARKDFKATHPGEVPLIFQLYNIKIDQSVVQMPLTLAFRNTVKNDWAYYASMGTNIKLSSKETISYDCRGPQNEFFNQTFSKKGDVSPITSMNFAVGVEKAWYPIVVQAEGYWVNYFKPMTPLRNSAGPGLKVKLMYQIGRQM